MFLLFYTLRFTNKFRSETLLELFNLILDTMNNIRPYVLKETNWREVRHTRYHVAVLPWGATEAHNYHLPYGTDAYLGEDIAIKAADQAWQRHAKVLVLPCVPFGVNTGQLDVPLCMNVNPSTQLMVLKDLIQVLNHHRIHKLVILNAHGGNHFKQMIREVYLDFPEMFVCSINWWEFADAPSVFEEPGDHAGELETSAMLYLRSDLVLPLSEAGPGTSIPYAVKAMREGKVTSHRIWSRATVDTGVGDPKASTVDKGEKFVEMATDGIAEFFIELASVSLDNLHQPGENFLSNLQADPDRIW